jgi:hypothetical protein
LSRLLPINKGARGVTRGRFFLCAEPERQLGGGRPLSSLMAAKDWRSARASSRGGLKEAWNKAAARWTEPDNEAYPLDERARDRKVDGHQGSWWEIRRARGEGGHSYCACLTGSCRCSRCCESTAEERGAGNPQRHVLWEPESGRPPPVTRWAELQSSIAIIQTAPARFAASPTRPRESAIRPPAMPGARSYSTRAARSSCCPSH